MTFSQWIYERPDYESLKNRLRKLKECIQNASSYEELRSAWLEVKREIEYMGYQDEIVYIRHLCGIDYEESVKEVEIQNAEEPEVYALRDECNLLVKNSGYATMLENEFGKQILAQVKDHSVASDVDSLRLQSEELQLKMQYRRLMGSKDRDDDKLFDVFIRLIETRRELAASLGYDSYIDFGYQLRCRYNYGREELSGFRNQIQRSVTPILSELKKSGIALSQFPARIQRSKELITAITEMFKDLSEESGAYIEEMVRNGLYDLESRANKRPNLWSCCMLPCKKLPFIVGNYYGDSMETGYAVHEFGHGFAFYTAARTQLLYEFHRSSPAVNEIHSKTMEHFMYPYLESFVGDRKKEYVRNHLLQQLENLVYRCAIDEFEHKMYDLPHRTRQQFCELWADISQKYMPWNQIGADAIHKGKCWPHQTHIVETPFYYIEYDIAQISTYEFHLKMQQNHKKAWEDYLNLCRAGGSKSYFELLATANLSNPFAEGTVERICGKVVEEMGEGM